MSFEGRDDLKQLHCPSSVQSLNELIRRVATKEKKVNYNVKD